MQLDFWSNFPVFMQSNGAIICYGAQCCKEQVLPFLVRRKWPEIVNKFIRETPGPAPANVEKAIRSKGR